MINTRKTTQDILQDEMLRERAATLARAGERLSEALGIVHHQRLEEFYRIPPKRRLLPEGGMVEREAKADGGPSPSYGSGTAA